MKRIWRFVIGGIESKIFNLVLFTFLTVTCVYMSVIWYQSKELTDVFQDSSRQQQESIRDISEETMQRVIQTSLTRINALHALKIDETFQTLESHIWFMNEYAARILGSPQDYEPVVIAPPDADNQGLTAAQMLYDEGVDPSSPATQRTAGLIGNMETLLESLYNNFYNLNSCFIGTADGVFLIVDADSAGKIDEDGTVKAFPFKEREWYQKTLNAGSMYISEIAEDFFTGEPGIVCSMPIIIDGKVAAVVGADFYLDNIKAAITESVIDGGFTFLVNQNSDIILSANSGGFFPLVPGDEPSEMPGTGELMKFIEEAKTAKTGVRVVKVGNDTYYMVGTPMQNVDWAAVTCISKEVTDQPLKMMYYEYQKINRAAEKQFTGSIGQSRLTLLVLLIMIFLIGLANALVLSRRIVKPLSTMTKEIGNMASHDLKFRMKDSYQTGDEIQVLAESFAELSAKTQEYIEEVRNVTAENERIGAEFHVARAIQSSVLPDPYTTFGGRKDFEIFALMDPAKEVGGDFYDFFLINEDHLAMVIADVSGKGVPAALLMMIAKSLIKNRLLDGDSPGEALENVNRQLAEGNTLDMFVTVWCAVLDLKSGEGIAANGGHEHPALRRRGGHYELLRYRHSPALGMMSDIVYSEHSFTLNKGDSLFVYTDGVPEATDPSMKQFGTDRLIESLNRDPDAGPETAVFNLTECLAAFSEGADQFDDITMLCMKYNG